MIIPRLTADPSTDVPTLISQVRHWSLLGTIAIANVEPASVSTWESVIELVGGSVDMILELTQPNNEDGLKLLNAGASSILCDPSSRALLDAVPDDCVVHGREDDDSDAAIVPGTLVWTRIPRSQRLAELEMVRIDCLVDSQQLDAEPQLMLDFFAQVLVTDRPDGLWPTVIVDPLGLALGLAYSNAESLLDALTHRRGTYWSRSRDDLWIKGATSGATQQLLEVRIDCDRDCLRFMVTQDPPGFCHRNTHSCFGAERTIESVIVRLEERLASTDEKSFTRMLMNDPVLLQKKLLEEARELAEASTPDHVAFEAADVLYFSLVKMLSAGVTLEQVHQELARRMNRVVRRKNKVV